MSSAIDLKAITDHPNHKKNKLVLDDSAQAGNLGESWILCKGQLLQLIHFTQTEENISFYIPECRKSHTSHYYNPRFFIQKLHTECKGGKKAHI